MTVRLRVGGAEIWLWDRYLETRFRDGVVVPAAGNDDPASIELAAALGYLSTWEMSRDHEIAHSWLAVQAGLDVSPALWHAGHPGEPFDAVAIGHEEARVLTFQATLDKSAPPWCRTALMG